MARPRKGEWTLWPHFTSGGSRSLEGSRTIYRCRHCSGFRTEEKSEARSHFFEVHLESSGVDLTMDMFNWLAKQLVEARRVRDELEEQVRILTQRLQDVTGIVERQVFPSIQKNNGVELTQTREAFYFKNN